MRAANTYSCTVCNQSLNLTRHTGHEFSLIPSISRKGLFPDPNLVNAQDRQLLRKMPLTSIYPSRIDSILLGLTKHRPAGKSIGRLVNDNKTTILQTKHMARCSTRS